MVGAGTLPCRVVDAGGGSRFVDKPGEVLIAQKPSAPMARTFQKPAPQPPQAETRKDIDIRILAGWTWPKG